MFLMYWKFNSKDKLISHLKNGAKKVIVSAPCKDADKTIVYGVNETELKNDDKIISAHPVQPIVAPVAHVLNENFVIEKGFMTTIHAFTSDQRILDNSHKDPEELDLQVNLLYQPLLVHQKRLVKLFLR